MSRTRDAKNDKPPYQSHFRAWYISDMMTLHDVIHDPTILGKEAHDLKEVPKATVNQLVLFEYVHNVRKDIYERNSAQYAAQESLNDSDSDPDEQEVKRVIVRAYKNVLSVPIIAKKIPTTSEEYYELAEALQKNRPFCDALCWTEPKRREFVIQQLYQDAERAGYVRPQRPRPIQTQSIERGSLFTLKANRSLAQSKQSPLSVSNSPPSVQSTPTTADSDSSMGSPPRSPDSATPLSPSQSGEIRENQPEKPRFR